MSTCIIWFRRDLRLHDNPALNWACQNSQQIIPVYIHAEDEEQPWAPGAASRWWLHNSLKQLDQSLQAYGLKLHCFSGKSSEQLGRIIQHSGADTLVFNRLYEPHLVQRDEKLIKHLTAQGLQVQSFHSNLLLPPESVLNQQQQPYRVFTPFYRKTRSLLEQRYASHSLLDPHAILQRVKPVTSVNKLQDKAFDLRDDHPWQHKLHEHWQPGEQAGHELLDSFVDQALQDYPEQRDIPASAGTSRLSPYLHFGEISPQQIYTLLRPMLEGALGTHMTSTAEAFLRQLMWREFSHQVLWHFPRTMKQPIDPRYSNRFWHNNQKQFAQWTRGETGVALVDAGMKQLWKTGWMHNRVRMIVASFLTKNLGISWLQGARWFWDTLVDADLANNSLGWQWVAGCGVDAAPYYRIFNPMTQSQKFDKDMKYLDRWLPQHRELDYPEPMVDLASSRKRALERYKQHITPRT